MKLTRAEEEIMQIIWELNRCTVSDIRNYMAEKMQVKKQIFSAKFFVNNKYSFDFIKIANN